MKGISTPAIAAVRRAAIEFAIHSYDTAGSHGPDGWGIEAAVALGLDPERVFKTLIVDVDDGGLAAAIIPVPERLRLKSVAAAFGGREARMAVARDAEHATGYVVGGISPLGQRRRLPTAIDVSARAFATIHVSAGRRGLEIELTPADLARLTGATFVELTARSN